MQLNWCAQHLVVNLPDGQLAPIRVDRKATFGDILQLICKDNAFDPDQYVLQQPTDGTILEAGDSPEKCDLHEVTLKLRPPTPVPENLGIYFILRFLLLIA